MDRVARWPVWGNVFAIGIGLAQSLAAPEAYPAPAPTRADVVLLGGKVLTVDGQNRVCSALAILGERILAVGSDEEIAPARIGPQTKVFHLRGKTVVPGFIESHVHSIGVARDSMANRYEELSSIAEVQQWIRRRAAQVPAGTWIVVPRNEITRLRERRHPTPEELDAACATHPVAFNSVQKWVLNWLGFERLGVTGDRQEVPGGRVLRDASGRPRIIVGGDAHLRRFFPYPKYSDEETLAALEKLLRHYNEVGITSINERAANRDGYRLFRTLHERGRQTVRATLTFRQNMRSAEDVKRFVEQLGLAPREGDDWVRAGLLKITVDGGIHWGTTRLSEPYGPRRCTFYLLDDPQYRGEQYYRPEEMREVFAAGHRLGWQMCCHVTGDGGIESVLDALEAVDRQMPLADRRFTLLHAYFPTVQIVERCRRLGVCVDTHPYLYYKDCDAIAEVYGPTWAERFIGLGDWLRGGVPFTLSSDHMEGWDPDHAMNSFRPLLAMSIAVSRINDRGKVYGPQQWISRIDALRAVTAGPAYLDFNEKTRGSLEPGKLADLVVLDRDYLNCPDCELPQIKVLMTMVGGRVVFERK